ncbi:MAG: AsmA family protein, partial [Bacteroidetes bacterium]|nr:AsmA family protein [Bacteroidota bacterium]
MKKILKITGLIIGVLILLLLIAPFLFKGSLEDLLKKNINENLNATVTWKHLNVSFLKSFPKAAVVLEDFAVINKHPFNGDTLASGSKLELDMGITQLFKSEKESVVVDQLILDEAKVTIKIDSLGRANYDIGKENEAEATTKSPENTSEGFTFNLTHYEINHSEIQYLDASSDTYLVLTELFHEGNGDLGAELSELNTHTQAKTSFSLGDINYLNAHQLTLDANFQLDLKNQKYSFLKNEAKVNDLPLVFDGFIQLLEDGTEMDLSFETPTSDFKNFLAIIPKKYVSNLNGVETTGDFSIKGTINGLVNDVFIPKMDVAIQSNNASFKYPNLPKKVENIELDVQLKNETGLTKDTYLTIGSISFKVDDELFNATGSLANLTGNMLVDLALKGTLNLANIEKVFPFELDQPLTGVFKADVTTQFDMGSIEKEQYDLIKTNGVASLKDFNYADPSFSHPINIAEADVTMAPGNITLNTLTATSGKTDIAAKGSIQNLIPWVMAKQDLKGRFTVDSNTFNVHDFMTSEEAQNNSTAEGGSTKTKETAAKLPDFLDATLDFTAKTLRYDNLVLDNAKGTVSIKDEAATLSNITSSFLGGKIGLNGSVSTK